MRLRKIESLEQGRSGIQESVDNAELATQARVNKIVVVDKTARSSGS
jgi:hypothetical protein